MFIALHTRRVPSRRLRRIRMWFAIVGSLLLLLALAPVLAHAQGAGPDTVTMVWTAPGDDGTTGRATAYEMRISVFGPVTPTSWTSANVVSGLPTPATSGTRERFVVRGLSRDTTYFFAIRAVDDQDNWAPVSNSVTWDWRYDTAPPAAPSGGRGTRESETAVRVRWSPNAEPDLAGYSVYRSVSSGGPYVAINGTPVSGTEFVDANIPDGTSRAYYQLTAIDDSGNESARSATFNVSMSGGGEVTGAWDLSVAFPNPSRTSQTVTFPIQVPTGGDAELRITNAAGQVVRRYPLQGLVPGPQSVSWDGLNQAGRAIAPGVYTAWLVAGKSQKSVKVVKTP